MVVEAIVVVGNFAVWWQAQGVLPREGLASHGGTRPCSLTATSPRAFNRLPPQMVPRPHHHITSHHQNHHYHHHHHHHQHAVQTSAVVTSEKTTRFFFLPCSPSPTNQRSQRSQSARLRIPLASVGGRTDGAGTCKPEILFAWSLPAKKFAGRNNNAAATTPPRLRFRA